MVHQYQLNGYNIVLDTCSGAIHAVDEVAYDIIALYPDHTADEIVSAMMEKYGEREDVTEQELRDCIADVEALKRAGKLYTPDTFADMAGTFKERSGDVVKALCLHVAHTCNLNCSYCFASQGKYHGDRALMSFEVGRQALDFLMDHSGSGLLRRRAADELGRGEAAGGVCPQRGKGAGQKFPFYADHQRDAHR